MKIVVDRNVPLAAELFGSHGQVDFVDGRNLSVNVLQNAEALIVRSVTPVNQLLLENTPVKFVGSCTIGTDHLDLEYLQKSSTFWKHAPGCNAQSVVEYVSSALAALDFVNPDTSSGLRAAVIGCGRVGRAVHDELVQLGMEVVVYDPFLEPGMPVADALSLTTLDDAMASNLVCMHTPLTRDGRYPTANMLEEKHLCLLKDQAVVVSAGRGGVVQEQALERVAKIRPDIRWVLDVWDGEPQINKNILDLATIATPHIAGYSMEGRRNGSWQIYLAFCEYFGFSPVAGSEEGKPSLEHSGIASNLTDLLLAVYDPREDDQRMRKACKSSHESDNGSWFDRQRRDYPERRERSAYQFSKKGFLPKGRSEQCFLTEAERAKKIGFRFFD